MFDSIIKAVLGNLDEKRDYRRTMRRANALPKEYRYAFRKMRSYLFTVGGSVSGAAGNVDLALFDGLIDLLEAGAAERRTVPELTGGNVAAFCDELLCASSLNQPAQKTRMNETIREQLPKEKKPC